MTTIRIPPGIPDAALAAALASIGLVVYGIEDGCDAITGEPIYSARHIGAEAVINRCATPGCARATVVRIGKYAYCATHGRQVMEEQT